MGDSRDTMVTAVGLTKTIWVGTNGIIIDMASTRTLEQIIDIVRCIVRESGALFGYVFELTPDAKRIVRGLPLLGHIRDAAVLQTYFRPVGERALDLLAQGEDQAVPLSAPDDADGATQSWFAAFLSQDLGMAVSVAIAYEFYDRDEAVRTLRLIQMIMTHRELR